MFFGQGERSAGVPQLRNWIVVLGGKPLPATLVTKPGGPIGGLSATDGWGVARGEPGLNVSEASVTAVGGWKQPGVTVIAAGDAMAVAGVPLCQTMNDRLLLWTSRPSVKVAWTTSIRGSLPFE